MNEIERSTVKRKFMLLANGTIILLAGFGLIVGIIRNLKEYKSQIKMETINATIIKSEAIEKDNIFTWLGLIDNTEYITVFNVKNTAIKSTDESIYFLCNENISSDIKIDINVHDDKIIEVVGISD